MTPVPGSILGKVNVSITSVDARDLSSSLQDILAWVNVNSIIINHADGTRVEYFALEYECDWCDSYDHKSIDCPNLDHDTEEMP